VIFLILADTGDTGWFGMASEDLKKQPLFYFDKYRRTAQNIALKYHKKHIKIVILVAICNARKL
jgi:hypothetical protein